MRIYISGAITGTEDFRERFLKAEKELIAVGHDTVNPARLNDIMPKDATHGEYMRMSFELLDICDAIYMLDGWENSKGANQGYGFAKGKGIEEEPLKYVGEEFVKGMYHDLWDSTIKKSDIDRYGWDANPWVWVIDFERCDKPKEE